jgi:hypothetical protein
MTESWRLKAERAKHHLQDIYTMMRTYEASHPYTAERVVQPKSQKHIWRYVLRVTEQPDPMLSILIGDFIHNIRSALDHIAVAISAPNRWSSAGFPISQVDIWAHDAQGNFVVGDDDARESFLSRIKGMDETAKTIIESLQPCCNVPGEGEAQTLTVLSRLENADKHRSLIAVGGGVKNGTTIVTARGDRLEQDAFGYRDDGAEIAKFAPAGPAFAGLTEAEVNVEVSGPTVIAIYAGRGEDRVKYAARPCLDSMVVALDGILTSLEPYVVTR